MEVVQPCREPICLTMVCLGEVGLYKGSGQTRYPTILTMSYVLPKHLHTWE